MFTTWLPDIRMWSGVTGYKVTNLVMAVSVCRWKNWMFCDEEPQCFQHLQGGVHWIYFYQKYPDVIVIVIVASELVVFKETSRHFQPCLQLPKQAFFTKSWCLPLHGFVPKPNQSISTALWQDSSRTFEPKDMLSCGLQHKETHSLNLQKHTWKRSPSK